MDNIDTRAMKLKVIDYFKYNHYNNHPAKENHHVFINNLGYLEEKRKMRLGETGNTVESWKQILSSINKLTDTELSELYTKIKKNNI